MMQFWGIEVKAGQPFTVQPGEEKLIHLSQASLGVSKKENANDSVVITMKIDGKNHVLGTLSSKIPQISYDVVIEKEFELSHNWKNGSVYFFGYKAEQEEEMSSGSSSESDEEMGIPINNALTETPEPKVEKAKPATDNGLVPAEIESEKSDDSDDSEDSEDEESEEEEEAPKKVESSKKRPAAVSATKTPVPAKKVKLATPQKTTDGKKGSAHVDTPHPSKQVAKTPAAAATTSQKPKAAVTPKSAGTITCNSCSKKFNSEGALQSHSKAKHEGK